ncbi:YchJ family metal-binding protein [Pollutimonas sp. H1-120]|uniref:YchJ family protein n=1 Tax=Pollutimonas sp. H1-120 TaxID=3148824 RepID=UPI003B52A4E0
MKQDKPGAAPCPCGGGPGLSYSACCQRFIDGQASAPDAERLMRSRYTAYALGLEAYLLATWHPLTRPAGLDLAPPGQAHGIRWLGLIVESHSRLDDTQAEVVFTARYREAGRAHRLHERSRFVLENGHWFYVDGDADFDASLPMATRT